MQSSYKDAASHTELDSAFEDMDKILIANISCRRHADRTVQLWLQRLKDSPSHKRLVLIYLANGMCLELSRVWT